MWLFELVFAFFQIYILERSFRNALALHLSLIKLISLKADFMELFATFYL